MTRHMRIPLDIDRDNGEGYYQAGKWVTGATSVVNILCSIQPYQAGNTKIVLPEGSSSDDAVIIITTTLLRTIDEFGHSKADRLTLDGNTYIAFKQQNWSRLLPRRTAHHHTVFLRQDKLKSGGLTQ